MLLGEELETRLRFSVLSTDFARNKLFLWLWLYDYDYD